MNLHDRIINLSCRIIVNELPNFRSIRLAYTFGHHDARHAAAELAIEADVIIEGLIAALLESENHVKELCTSLTIPLPHDSFERSAKLREKAKQYMAGT